MIYFILFPILYFLLCQIFPMSSKLRIISYNCQSFNRKIPIIKDLLNTCDLLLLQETLISDDKFDGFNNIDDNFVSVSIPAIRKNDITSGRASGGLAIFWRKTESISYHPIYIPDRIIGLKIVIQNVTYLILNVYFFCDYGDFDSILNYKSMLAELSSVLDDEIFDEVLIVGDMNADPSKGRFFRELEPFMQLHSLFMPDIHQLPQSSYTYISSNEQCSTSWIDHIISSKNDFTSNHKIFYGSAVYDHIPIYFEAMLPATIQYSDEIPPNPKISVAWDKISFAERKTYMEVLDQIALNIWNDVLSCNVTGCSDSSHSLQLEQLYELLIDAVFSASEILPQYAKNSKQYSVVGWNMYCKNKYNLAKRKFLEWHNSGRIRFGELFENMKSSRKEFKSALKFSRKNQMNIRKQIILEKFRNASKSTFWKEIRKITSNKDNKISYLDGESNPEKIAQIFDAKFSKIFNDPSCKSPSASSCVDSNDDSNPSSPLISLNNVQDAILKINTSLGWDKIHSNHLKYSGPIFRNLICKIFNKFLSHNFVPPKFVEGQVKPIVKNSCLGKTNSSNFRPIMNSSNFLKIFENCLSPYLERHLVLNKRQFGFRAKTSCSSAHIILKEVIKKYTTQGSNVHCVMIDLSKAFDKVNHKLLIQILRSSSLPCSLVNTLKFMFENTYANVSVNNITTKNWKIENGTRQGGILSPLFFAYYINHIIDKISGMEDGCSLAGVRNNILCYADDVCLLAPSPEALQSVLDVLYQEVKTLGLSINVDKSAHLIFKHRKSLVLNSVVCLEGLTIKRVHDYKYLGIVLSEDLSLDKDINRISNSFLKQFYSMYSKFYHASNDVLHYLFKAYSNSFYGIEMCFDAWRNREVNKLAITYHKAVKRVARLNVWDSNHEGCSIVGVPIFQHMMSKRIVSYFFSLMKSESPCLLPYKYYFRHLSFINKEIDNLMESKYEVINFKINPLCALFSRLNYVERHEPRRR